MDEEPRAAGWYVRPEMVNTQGYWDGEKWTDQTQPLPQESAGSVLAGQMVRNLVILAGFVVFILLVRALLMQLD